jgi:hypothetical protein
MHGLRPVTVSTSKLAWHPGHQGINQKALSAERLSNMVDYGWSHYADAFPSEHIAEIRQTIEMLNTG